MLFTKPTAQSDDTPHTFEVPCPHDVFGTKTAHFDKATGTFYERDENGQLIEAVCPVMLGR